MRIISLNVNGLRAFYNRGPGDGMLLQDLVRIYNPDIILFQEIKCNLQTFIDWLVEWPDYQKTAYPNLYSPGYAGVGAMFKVPDGKNYKFDTKVFETDSGYDSGRIIRIDTGDYYLIGVYVLNSGDKDDLRKNWNVEFQKYIKECQLVKPVIVIGDLNVCSNTDDCWAMDQYFDIMPGCKQYEMDDFHLLISECNLIDTWKSLHNEDDVQYTWFSYRGDSRYTNKGFRLDYALVDSRLFDKVESCEVIGGACDYSDHSPLLLDIK